MSIKNTPQITMELLEMIGYVEELTQHWFAPSLNSSIRTSRLEKSVQREMQSKCTIVPDSVFQ